MSEIAKPKGKRNSWRKAKAKLPVQSWTLKEKLDVVTTLCADRRFSHAEARVGVTMILYFHNTQSGDLHPSRTQISEQACVTREVVINATKKMRRLGYLEYAESDGGCHHRNTYVLRKLTVGNSDSERSAEPTPTVGKTDSYESEKPTPNYPCKLSGNGETSPLPCDGRATVSPESQFPTSQLVGSPRKGNQG